ncbi:glycoside hydrolase [Horticoccus luteus]|uniref:Glycoside hydrolase n=1 Tax=Horticoccus luteus TaxID=2862869 RepID=A0A8F9TV38_9BACT|nr:sialidase family protein [Horticoccus luteus]QYM78838.1 glycoside hydrolase [Horticoccus luteus]
MKKLASLLLLAGVAFSSNALAGEKTVSRTEVQPATQPQLAADLNGEVWLTYGHAEAILVRRSGDGGETFGEPIKVATLPSLALGMRRGPRIAVHGDHVTITAIGDELVSFHSGDGGRTWSAAVTINDVATSAREGLHDLATAPDGRLFVTWLDLREGAMMVCGAESVDHGRTWSKNEPIYRSPDKSVCECCHPSATFDAQGNLAVMWRNSIAGSRDLWMATRAAGAREFSVARKLGQGTWKIAGCPMDGGRIVAYGHGRFGSVWQRAGEIYFTADSGSEVLLGRGKQPVAVVCDGKVFACWQDGPNLVTAQLGQGAAAKHASNAKFATALALPGGGLLVAYEQAAETNPPGIVIERW